MSPSGVPVSGRRARSRRAADNDARILDAALEVMSAQGWDELTASAVAKQAGLSSTPLYARFGDLSGLGAELWRARLGTPLCEALQSVVRAAHSPNRAGELPEALRPFALPSPELVAAVDLLIASGFDQPLGAVVFGELGACLRETCEASASVTRVHAAQSVYVVALALGLVMLWPRARSMPISIDQQVAELCEALAHPAKPARLPDVSPDDLAPLVMSSDDFALDDLHSATLVEVGLRGYRHATVQRIASAAQVSQGFIFGRYSDKRELFVDASARRHQAAYDANAKRLADLQRRRGLGIAEAIAIRTLMQPGIEVQRGLQLEQQRLSWFDIALHAELDKAVSQYLEQSWAEVTESVGDAVPGQQHVDVALGFGVSLAAAVLPDAWQLPFDAVTVPLLG